MIWCAFFKPGASEPRYGEWNGYDGRGGLSGLTSSSGSPAGSVSGGEVSLSGSHCAIQTGEIVSLDQDSVVYLRTKTRCTPVRTPGPTFLGPPWSDRIRSMLRLRLWT